MHGYAFFSAVSFDSWVASGVVGSGMAGRQAGRGEEWEIHFNVYVYIELYFSSLFNASSSATF